MSKVFIRDKRNDDGPKHFVDLKAGDAFIFDDHLFIKSLATRNDENYALRLIDGSLKIFTKFDKVEQVVLDISIYKSIEEKEANE